MQPYQAVKAYRCPGCDHEIPPGLGHEVVVPRDAPEDRRHWHTSCWHRVEYAWLAVSTRAQTHSQEGCRR